MAHTVKGPPAMQETCVQSLGWEDPLEKEMATHSSVLAWRISWTEEPGGYSPQGQKVSDMTERLTLPLSSSSKFPSHSERNFFLIFFCIIFSIQLKWFPLKKETQLGLHMELRNFFLV